MMAVGVSLVLGAMLAPVQAQVGDYEINAVNSSVNFKVSYLGVGRVRGHFGDISGKVHFDTEHPEKSLISVVIKAASVDTGIKGLDNHLRGEGFFNVDKFPNISFKSTSLEREAPGVYKLTGDLTLLKKTQKIATSLMDAGEVVGEDGKMRRHGKLADIVIKRSDYGMTGMLGPVGDKITLYIEYSALKK